jgi:hypothetical protein
MFIDMFEDSLVEINELTFNTCKSTDDGGSFYTKFSDAGTLIMNDLNLFKNCKCGRLAGGY